jgi:hypothetical protein
VTSATGIFVGMYVSHPKVPVGTTIDSIVGTAIHMTANATATVSSAARFSPVLDAQTLGQKGGVLSRALTLLQLPTGITSSNLASIALSVVFDGQRHRAERCWHRIVQRWRRRQRTADRDIGNHIGCQFYRHIGNPRRAGHVQQHRRAADAEFTANDRDELRYQTVNAPSPALK